MYFKYFAGKTDKFNYGGKFNGQLETSHNNKRAFFIIRTLYFYYSWVKSAFALTMYKRKSNYLTSFTYFLFFKANSFQCNAYKLYSNSTILKISEQIQTQVCTNSI